MDLQLLQKQDCARKLKADVFGSNDADWNFSAELQRKAIPIQNYRDTLVTLKPNAPETYRQRSLACLAAGDMRADHFQAIGS